ncbi:hypothetical protein JCM33374_g3945 [Metschnikowia sp. JCM 33374]|nr:hypothetical protein JCM33374_g3945 [Metschnikowia sp. JCM 33374]
MAYPLYDAPKAENPSGPQVFPPPSRQAPPISAQTPISAQSTIHLPVPPTSVTPLSQQYDSAQPTVPPLAPTPLNTLNSLNTLSTFHSVNSSGTHTPLGPLGQNGQNGPPGPPGGSLGPPGGSLGPPGGSLGPPGGSFGSLGPPSYPSEPSSTSFQSIRASHSNTSVSAPSLVSGASANGPTPAHVPSEGSNHPVPENNTNNNIPHNSTMATGPGLNIPGANLGPNSGLGHNSGLGVPGMVGGSIPGLNAFMHGNSFRRTTQDHPSDPSNFGSYAYGALPGSVPPSYPHMMPSQVHVPQAFPHDPSQQYAGFNMQLGPIPGHARGGPISGTVPVSVPSYYPAAQPSLQPLRYHMEDRGYSDNARPIDEPFLAPAKTRAPFSYQDQPQEYTGSSAYRMGPMQQVQTQSSNPGTTIPSLPSLLKQHEPYRPVSSMAMSDTMPSKTSHSPVSATSGIYSKRSSEDAELDVQTNFRPTETKKNKRPKINMLASDSSDFKQASNKKKKLVVEEYSFDETYANFQDLLGIPAPRADINKVYHLVLQSPLERYLFDFFVHKIAVFIDTFLAHQFFQVIVAELALYDETRMILDSMLCLSSLISQRMDPSSVDALCPYDYYQKCVYSVGKKVGIGKSEDPDGKILARCLISTNLLCIYEMFFVAVDSVYVKGAGGILATIMSRTDKSVSILKQSPFHHTCFWATIVCDLILSLKLECPNTFSVEKMWRNLDPNYDVYDTL